MLDVKAAVATAMKFAQDILQPDRQSGMLLEEVERTIDEGYGYSIWLITLSVPTPISALNSVMGSGKRARDYKIVKIDAESGEPLSMKIRELAGVQ